jgi:hypothetical protein
MTPAISEDLKQRIVKWYLDDEETMESVAVLAGCSVGLVHKVLQTHREHSLVTDPFHRRTGRPKYLTDDGILDGFHSLTMRGKVDQDDIDLESLEGRVEEGTDGLTDKI